MGKFKYLLQVDSKGKCSQAIVSLNTGFFFKNGSSTNHMVLKVLQKWGFPSPEKLYPEGLLSLFTEIAEMFKTKKCSLERHSYRRHMARDVFHLLVPSLNSCNSQGQTRRKPHLGLPGECQGPRELGISSTASSGTLAGSWIVRRTTGS